MIFFDMYIRSFERVWEVSSPIEESNFWRQRAAAINSQTPTPNTSLQTR